MMDINCCETCDVIKKRIEIRVQEQLKKMLSDIPCPQQGTNKSILDCDCVWCESIKEQYIK